MARSASSEASGAAIVPVGKAWRLARKRHPAIDLYVADGSHPSAAGAYLAPDTLRRAWAQGINPMASLDDNDGHGFFGALGDSIVTGPTLTNVNDFRAVLIAPN